MPLLELEALVSKAKAEALRLLLLSPERSFYQREVVERTGLRIRTVQQALEPLGDAVALVVLFGSFASGELRPESGLLARA